MADRNTGTAAPMPMPMITGNAVAKVMVPVTDRAWRIPTEAELDWSTAVISAPMRMPSTGFSNMVISWMKGSLSRRGDTAELMACMPYIKTAKPSRISPVCFLRLPRPIMRNRIPTRATSAERVAVLNRDRAEPPPILDRQRIQPVTEVPMLAPMTMPMAWLTSSCRS